MGSLPGARNDIIGQQGLVYPSVCRVCRVCYYQRQESQKIPFPKQMNTEYERKYKVESLAQTKSTVEKLGGNLGSSRQTIDTYFAMPSPEQYLRVRVENGEAELAFHLVRSDTETQEYETAVSDGKVMIEILKKLGFETDIIVKKNRESYSLGNSKIELDTVEGLGNFVEIEAESEQAVFQLAQKLGLQHNQLISGAGYPDLLRANK